MKNTLALIGLLTITLTSTAFARMSEPEYVEKCMQLASVSGRSGPDFSCSAKSKNDVDLLESVGIESPFNIHTDNAWVGSWGDGTNKYYGEVAITAKAGFFGFGKKVVVINCIEKRTGQVRFNGSDLHVIIKEGIDSQVRAYVECR